MPDDLFNRFRPAPQQAVDLDEDSRHALQATHGSGRHPIREAELHVAIDHLPSLPLVVDKILHAVGGEQVSAASIEELVAKDMAIAGRLLRMVNSPFYGLSQPVGSIAQAVTMVGFTSLKSLVLAASVSNLMAADLAVYGFTENGLWSNAVATAALARSIALMSGLSPAQAEEYACAGLLRDLGMLVLGPFLAKIGVTLRRVTSGENDILRRERAVLGYDHCWVGDRIAERWRLPKGLRLCMGKHHRIPANVDLDDMRQLAAVRLAERLTYAARIGVVENHPFDARVDGVLLLASGLNNSRFEQLVAQVPSIVSAADNGL